MSDQPDRQAIRHSSLSGKRAAVILFSHYPYDPRPSRAVHALVEAGMAVDLLCLAQDGIPGDTSTERNLNIFRISINRRRSGKWSYIWEYLTFFCAAFWFLLKRGLHRRYDLVHVHNMPDFLVFSALLPRLQGSKIILDVHDPMPELMMTMFEMSPTSMTVKFLLLLEKWSMRFAHLGLTPNLAFRRLFESRGCPAGKMHIIVNTPRDDLFDPGRFAQDPSRDRRSGEFRIIHHGLIAHRHGLDLLLEAVALVRPAIPGIILELYGARTPFMDKLETLTEELGLAAIVKYGGHQNRLEIARRVYESDLAVVPNRLSPFTNINFPTRIFESLAMHRPVIAPNTPGIRDYFNEHQLIYFRPGDIDDLAAKILWVYNHPAEAAAVVERGREVYQKHLWPVERSYFLDLVETLLAE